MIASPGPWARSEDIPFDDAQTMVQRLGLTGPLSPDDEYYPADVVADTRHRLGQVASELSDEIRRSFDYYQGQEQAKPITELIVSGRGALVRNLDGHLAEALGIRVELANPLTHISQNSSGVPDSSLAYMAPYLAVAIGLALPGGDTGVVRRINLLPLSDRARTTTDFGVLTLLVVFIIAVFAIALGYYLLHNTLSDQRQQLASAQAETASLENPGGFTQAVRDASGSACGRGGGRTRHICQSYSCLGSAQLAESRCPGDGLVPEHVLNGRLPREPIGGSDLGCHSGRGKVRQQPLH